MKLLVITTLLGAMSALCGPITYNVNRTIGAGSVSGTIQTDGTVGILGSSNILDWNLLLNDGTTSFTNLGPASGNNSEILFTATTNLTATPSQLLFDFNGPTGGVMFQSPFIGSGVNYWCVQTTQALCVAAGFVGEGVTVSSSLETSALTGNQVIGTAATGVVPEPSSLALIGLGVTGLLARRAGAGRTRRQTATA